MLKNNLIVNYLPPSFRDQELKKLFQQYGNIIHSKVICSKNTSESLTYGFVMFEKEEDANKALNDMNGLSVCGKQLKVSVARPRNFGGKGCKLHISKLPSYYTWDMVNNLFSQFGEIIELRLLVNQDGNSRQVAFIQYSNREESDAAISAMSGYVPPGGENGLAIKYATNHKTSKFQENEYDEFSFDSHSITSSSNFIHQPEYDSIINYQNPVSINNVSWNLSQSYPETPTYQYHPPWINSMIALQQSNISNPQMLVSQPLPSPPQQQQHRHHHQHHHHQQQQTLSNNIQSRHTMEKAPPIYHQHSNIPQSHHPINQHQPYITSNMWPIESEYIQHYIQPPLAVSAASATNSNSSGNIVVQTYQNQSNMQKPIENVTQSSTTMTTNSNITKSNILSNTKDSRNRRNLIQQSSSTSSDSSTSTPYYQNNQLIYPNNSSNSRTSTPTPIPNYQNGQEYIVTIKDISSSHDIMSFAFLSSYGRIVEGKLLHILSQDNNSTRISVKFIILPHNMTTFSQLQQLHNSAIILDGISMIVALEQKTQT